MLARKKYYARTAELRIDSEIIMSEKPWRLSVKVLIRDDVGRCLLLKRSMNSKGNPGRWEPPGGKIDPRESFDTALLREVAEETGLTVSIQHVAGTAESELPKIRVVHLILEGKMESGQLRLSDEHTAHTWIRPQEFSKLDLTDWFGPFAAEYSKRKGTHPETAKPHAEPEKDSND
jgi:8-oxo-dGTP diphosphatase